MLHKKIIVVLSIIVLIIWGLVFLTREKSSSSSLRRTLPSPLNKIATTPEIIQHHCLNESEVSNLISKTYTLVRESALEDRNVLQCEYQASEVVNNVLPSLSYTYVVTDDQHQWESTRDEIARKSSVRRIENKEYLLADVNPVKEIAQVTFYGTAPETYLELTYTPVEGKDGDLLSAGEKLMDKVLAKN